VNDQHSAATAGPDGVRPAAEVDAAWLTAVFHRAGLGTGAAVASVTSRSIGTGQVGENVRFELTWDGDPGDAPTSVVGKFPSPDPVSRQAGVMTRTYVREAGFYRDLRQMVGIRIPRLYHLGWAPEDDHNFTIIMEDLRHSEQGDQVTGCTLPQAEAVVDEAVGLHAPTWGWMDRGLNFGDWLDTPSGPGQSLLSEMIGVFWPQFVDCYRGRYADDVLAFGEAVVANYDRLVAAGTKWAEDNDAWCVAHGDYRLDNMLFGRSPGAPPVCVVDWQTAAVSFGPRDVAYFLASALSPDQRAEVERGLVARYAGGLRNAGIDIDDDSVWDGYVLGSPSCFIMAVFASQAVGRTDRGDDMFQVMAEGSIAQMRHLGVLNRL
jgi:hypothetical protein